MAKTLEEKLEAKRAYHREYQKKRRQRDLDRAREYGRKWYAENKDKARESARQHYWNNREKEIARVVEGNKRYRKLARLQAIETYGGKCKCCGEQRLQFLAIDHIDGNGTEHRKNVIGNQTVALWLKRNKYPQGFQVLCHNCNSAKGFYGFCPHQVERGEISELDAINIELNHYDRTPKTSNTK